MNYKIFPPASQLNELVQCFWTMESDRAEVTPKEYFLMADNCLEIIFQYNGGFKTYSKQSTRIRLQHSECDKFIVEKEIGLFGVRLYPHVASQLLAIPASETVNRVFDFSTIFRQKGRDVSDQIYNAATTKQRIELLSTFLCNEAWQNKPVDPISRFVKQIMALDGQVDVSSMQQQSGLSVKQFERRFKAIAGFPPKYFARISRFMGAKRKYNSSKIRTMTGLAYTCDYYDQSHFIRDFKEFSGIQPLRYFRETDKCNMDSGITNDQRLPCGWFV